MHQGYLKINCISEAVCNIANCTRLTVAGKNIRLMNYDIHSFDVPVIILSAANNDVLMYYKQYSLGNMNYYIILLILSAANNEVLIFVRQYELLYHFARLTEVFLYYKVIR